MVRFIVFVTLVAILLAPSFTADMDTAIQLDVQALYGAMKGWGTNEQMVWSILENRKPEDIKKIESAYQKFHPKGNTLRQDLKSDLGGRAELRAMDILDNVRIDKRLYNAMQGLGTYEEGLWGILENKSSEELIQAQLDYPTNHPQNFSLRNHLKKELSGKDEQRAMALLPIPPDCVIMYDAMQGAGTDEAAIFNLLENRSTQELVDLMLTYQQFHPKGNTLVKDLRSDLSGKKLEKALAILDKARKEYHASLSNETVGNTDPGTLPGNTGTPGTGTPGTGTPGTGSSGTPSTGGSGTVDPSVAQKVKIDIEIFEEIPLTDPQAVGPLQQIPLQAGTICMERIITFVELNHDPFSQCLIIKDGKVATEVIAGNYTVKIESQGTKPKDKYHFAAYPGGQNKFRFVVSRAVEEIKPDVKFQAFVYEKPESTVKIDPDSLISLEEALRKYNKDTQPNVPGAASVIVDGVKVTEYPLVEKNYISQWPENPEQYVVKIDSKTKDFFLVPPATPLTQVLVTVTGPGTQNGLKGESEKTDTFGKANPILIQPGKYSVVISLDGYQTITEEMEFTEGSVRKAFFLEKTTAQMATVEGVVYVPRANGYDHIMIPGAEIIVFDSNGNPVRRTTTDANGRFKIEKIPYDIYDIMIKKEGYADTTIGKVSFMEPNKQIRYEMKNKEEIKIEEVLIDGFVYDKASDGKSYSVPVPNCEVILVDTKDISISQTTGSNGRYQFKRMKNSGFKKIIFNAKNYNQEEIVFKSDKISDAERKSLEKTWLTAKDSAVFHEIIIVSETVVQSSSTQKKVIVPNAKVQITSSETNSSYQPNTVYTDSKGQARVQLPQGSYNISISAYGYLQDDFAAIVHVPGWYKRILLKDNRKLNACNIKIESQVQQVENTGFGSK